MTIDAKYLLGHDRDEWDRLEAQHQLWKHTLLDILPEIGIGPGCAVLEAGCGNGVLLRDLADAVGPTARVVGIERDAAAAAQAEDTVADRPWVSVRRQDLFDLEPPSPGEAFHLVVARWVLGWLPNPERALERLAQQLRPDGLLLLQDYNYDSISLTPAQPALARLFEVMPKAYARHGGDAWLAVHFPRLLAGAGLRTIRLEPHCKAGGPDSPVFNWVERFFREHVHRLVEDGLLSDAERDGSLEAWDRAHESEGTVFFSPLVVTAVGKR